MYYYVYTMENNLSRSLAVDNSVYPIETLLEAEYNGAKIKNLPLQQQLDYLTSEHFASFVHPSNRLWRLEHLYYIMTKEGTKELFTLNTAQRDFFDNYLNKGYKKLIILKSRQLGFCLDPNTRVLTADLEWVKIKDIPIGQHCEIRRDLGAFDESEEKEETE